MKRLAFFSVIFFALAFWGRGQVNLVPNGGFELLHNCPNGPYQIDSAIGWHKPLAGGGSPDLFNFCCSNPPYCGIPSQTNFNSFQYPHTGKGYAGFETLYGGTADMREYIQNRLIKKLYYGHTYCVGFYISLLDNSHAYITKLGAYFDDGNITSSTSFGLIQVTPQVYNSTLPLDDTLNWIKIEGSFIASANEEYITLGNFFDDNNSGLIIIGTPSYWYTYYYIDDVSVIDAELPATAGNDILIHPSDSTFIGRPSEVGLDEDCIWFVNGIPIDTIAGFWVKPDTTTTYVLQQTICGNIKYDTITVTVSGVGVQEYNTGNNWVHLFPNPATTQINIETNSAISEIIITDISGKTILRQTVNNSNESDRVTWSHPVTNVDISQLAPGLYFIKIISDKQSLVRKIMVY